MAKQRDPIYVASTLGQNNWRVNCYRTDRGEIVATATEGRRKMRQYMGRPSYSWETVLGMGAGGGDRSYRLILEDKRLTDKVWTNGTGKMLAMLKANGLSRDGDINVIDEGVLA